MPSMNIGDWYQPYEQGNDQRGNEEHFYINFRSLIMPLI